MSQPSAQLLRSLPEGVWTLAVSLPQVPPGGVLNDGVRLGFRNFLQWSQDPKGNHAEPHSTWNPLSSQTLVKSLRCLTGILAKQ